MNGQEEQWLLAEKYNGEKSDAFFAECKRLALGEPLGYLIGYVPFLNCKIWLDSRPLIPRPETEFWTELAIAEIKQQPEFKLDLGFDSGPLHIMDMCSGSGCVGIAVAKAIPDSQVDFAELEQKHLATITKNLTENEIVTARTRVLQSNLFSAFPGEKYDFIFSNPPYIDTHNSRADESVVDFEPHVALFGGRDGMEIITQLIIAAPNHLKPSGQLWIEHEPEQSAQITLTAEENGFKCSTHRDQYDVERYSVLVLQ